MIRRATFLHVVLRTVWFTLGGLFHGIKSSERVMNNVELSFNSYIVRYKSTDWDIRLDCRTQIESTSAGNGYLWVLTEKAWLLHIDQLKLADKLRTIYNIFVLSTSYKAFLYIFYVMNRSMPRGYHLFEKSPGGNSISTEIHGEKSMSTINQINNLSNASAAKPGGSEQISGSSTQNHSDWFTDSSIDSTLSFSTSNYFDAGTSIDQMSQSILSCLSGSSL